jgi:LysR family transcriptional regulator, chromosome initiation inhibitor
LIKIFLMQLDPKPLNAFAAVVETGSLAAAALQLRITLAAVSIRIKTLETQLGQRLLVRGKTTTATSAGQQLLAHIRRTRLLEAELTDNFAATAVSGSRSRQPRWQNLHVAVNADSLASWFLPGVKAALQKHYLLLQCVVDDQEHTLDALKNGDVIGCVTQWALPLRGCTAQPLGIMRYRCWGSPDIAQRIAALQTKPRRTSKLAQPHLPPAVTLPASLNAVEPPHIPALLQIPALCFNAKDSLQDQFIQQLLGLQNAAYPRHQLPAADAYLLAMNQGLGWGMLADVQHQALKASAAQPSALLDLFPGYWIDVPLYWHHWQQESVQATRLTQAVVAAAQLHLLPATEASAE